MLVCQRIHSCRRYSNNLLPVVPEDFLSNFPEENLAESTLYPLVESVGDSMFLDAPPTLTRTSTMCTELVEEIIEQMSATQLNDFMAESFLEDLPPLVIPPPVLNRRSTSDSSWDFVSPVATTHH